MGVADFFSIHKRVVVVDTEYTTWEGAMERKWSGENEHREIFQISALIVDLHSDQIVDSFECFVYPRKNPLLSAYAVNLTGITQAQVDQGVDFREMYTEFLDWSLGLSICSYVRSAGTEGEGEVIKENLDLYNLDLRYEPHTFINLAALFKEAGVAIERFSCGELHRCFDVEVPGNVHDAVHDVHSLAVSLIALKQESTESDDVIRHG